MKNVQLTNYILTNKSLNEIIKFHFAFENEEILFYFINFLKILSMKFNSYPIDLFYNRVM